MRDNRGIFVLAKGATQSGNAIKSTEIRDKTDKKAKPALTLGKRCRKIGAKS